MQFSFAKNLATVEKKVRDEAFIDMKSQLLKETELSSLEFLKLWKVLFYGYWLSDKTEVQLDLAEKISMITLDLNPTLGIEYIRYFWQTIISEWHGIDKFRIDKYYSLLRHMHFSSFKLLELNNWDPNLLASFSQMLIEGILNPTSLSVPESLLIHFLEVYLPILVATSSKIPSVAWPFLLEPLFTYVAFSNRRHLIPLVSQTFRNKALLDLQKHPESCQPILRHIQSHFSTMQVSKKGKNTVATLLRPFSCVS